MNIVTVFLGISVGATTAAERFLSLETIKIIVLGLTAFCFSTVGGLLVGKIMYKVSGGKINPLIGSAGVSAVPMAARVSQMEGQKANPSNFESGIDVIDCATSCFSGGTSQPSTETMYYALSQYGIESGLNEDIINKVNDYFKPIKQKYIDNGQLNPKSLATDAQALVYKVPGGMLSNMIANLTDMHAMDKFDAALAEIPKVRADMGYPPLVTPLSQMVGNQAVTNVLVGERYKNISPIPTPTAMRKATR